MGSERLPRVTDPRTASKSQSFQHVRAIAGQKDPAKSSNQKVLSKGLY